MRTQAPHTPPQYRGDLRGSKDHIHDLVSYPEMEERPLSSKYLKRISNHSVSRSVPFSTIMTALSFAFLVGGAEGISVCQNCSFERNNSIQSPQKAPSEFLSFNDTILPANQTTLLESALQELSLPLNRTLSPREIVDRLLAKQMACDPDLEIQEASRLLNATCGKGVSRETTETVRNVVSKICSQQPSAKGCSDWNVSSAEAFEESVHSEREDLRRIDERFKHKFIDDYNYTNVCKRQSCPEVRIARQLLSLQHKIGKDYYIFTHGMTQVNAAVYPTLISEIHRRLYPENYFKEFIYARAIPPSSPEIPLSALREYLPEDEGLWCRIDLLSTWDCTSALWFYSQNDTPYNHHIVDKILETFKKPFNMVSSYCSFNLSINELKDTAWDWYQSTRWNRNCKGRIIAYAVPKSLIHNASTSFVALFDYWGDNSWTFLGQLPTWPGNCSDHTPTARILTSHLRPDKGIKAFWFGEPSQEVGIVTEKVSHVAEDFFKDVVQHCQNRRNVECKRLLSYYHLSR